MKNKYYAFIVAIIWIFFAYELYAIYDFLVLNPAEVLSSPHGNSLVSLSLDLSEGFYYYHFYELNKLSNPNFSNWLIGLSPNIAAVIFFQLSILFILLFAKIRKTEHAFLLFSISLSIQYILFFDFIGVARFDFFYYVFTLMSNTGFLFLFFTLINRKIPWYLYALNLLVFAGIAAVFYPDSIEEEIRMFTILGAAHVATFAICLGAFLYDEIRPRARYTIKSRTQRRIFAVTSLAIIVIPILSYLVPIYSHISLSIFYNAIFYIPAIFPMLLMIFSLHNNYIFFNKPVKTWYLRLTYFVFYIFLYGIIVSFEGQFFSHRSSFWIIHIAAVLAFIFIFDSLRLLSEITMNYYVHYRKFIFDEHLTDIFQFIHTPFQFEDGIRKFLKITEAASGAGKVTILLNRDLFGNWLEDKYNMRLVGEDDPIWSYRKRHCFSTKLRIITMDDLGYPGVFLRKSSGVIMIYFENFKAAIILSEKKNLTPYLSEDLVYLYDLISQIEPILDNYKLLINNIETKKFEKELEIVSRLQGKLKRDPVRNRHLHVSNYIKPYRFVTGDYLEVFPLSKEKYLFLLGDVSGHGLASAYFMGMVHSLIDGLINSRHYTLTEIFTLINSALITKQSSTSLMTLTAIEITLLKNKSGYKAVLSYINAGQHCPLIFLKDEKKLVELPGNQRVLGVVKTQYSVSQREYDKNFRLIMTSDGAFEIFNERGEILGEQKFMTWVRDTAHLPLEEQKNLLLSNIREYSNDPEMYDDISMLLIDIDL